MVRNYLDYAGLKRVIGKLFGIRRIWHGTAAEWEALTPAERDYYDQAEVIDGGVVEEQYTTEEVYTGKKWIDGKKIYRRILRKSVVNGVIETLANVAYITKLDGFFTSADQQFVINAPSNTPTGTYFYAVIFNSSTKNLNGYVEGSYITGDLTIILEYTKTTD